MKILKLLNKKYLSIILIFFLPLLGVQSEEPTDIWEIEEKNTSETLVIENSEQKNVSQNNIYEMQSQKVDLLEVEEDEILVSKEFDIVGIYDPAQNGLNINMWTNSNGEEILNLFQKINKINLSNDAAEILEILLLTNTYYPQKNISKKQFMDIKSSWLIKNSNLQLIEEYLINNQLVNDNPKLARYYVDYYLARMEIKKSCEFFSKIKLPIQDKYLLKFNIYCLINNNKKNEAQLLLDLNKELGFKDKFYEKKVSYLMGYNDKSDVSVSEATILDFHLSHRTNPDFKFEPKNDTSKLIWKYLSSSNLLRNIQDIELTDFDKIKIIEKATHEKNYTEKDLLDLYKRFQFNINQLLNIKESTKLLTKIETRALIYQGILITTDIEKKFELLNALKNSFKNDGIEKAFNQELKKFLMEVDIEKVPSNYTTFYERYIKDDEVDLTDIKINNKILHQSKLLNYFNGDVSIKNITKDLDDILKKIKRNKKYFFSKKDIILVEALKSDGINVSKKYENLYEINDSEMPADIQNYINNEEMGIAMLRIVQVIGQDQLKDIDVETMYFIINTLNQLDIDPIRNDMLLKILPLKV